MKEWASLPLRLGLGVVFIAHGAQKVFGVFGGSGISGFAETMAGLGFSPSLVWAYAIAYIELVGGIFLILGLLTRIFSVLLFLVMAGAFWKVHGNSGFLLTAGGFEYVWILGLSCLSLAILGSGQWAVNKKL